MMNDQMWHPGGATWHGSCRSVVNGMVFARRRALEWCTAGPTNGICIPMDGIANPGNACIMAGDKPINRTETGGIHGFTNIKRME